MRRTALGSICASCLSIQSGEDPNSLSRVLPVVRVAWGLYLPLQPRALSICLNDAATIGLVRSSRCGNRCVKRPVIPCNTRSISTAWTGRGGRCASCVSSCARRECARLLCRDQIRPIVLQQPHLGGTASATVGLKFFNRRAS